MWLLRPFYEVAKDFGNKKLIFPPIGGFVREKGDYPCLYSGKENAWI
jgi:hypothetical protein